MPITGKGLHRAWRWTLQVSGTDQQQTHVSRPSNPVSEQYMRDVVIKQHERLYNQQIVRNGGKAVEFEITELTPLSEDDVIPAVKPVNGDFAAAAE